MKKNPVVPYLLIIAFGLGLIFFMSLNGIDKKEEATKKAEDPKTEQTEGKTEASEPDAEAITTAKCISCHGEGLKGSVGPSLHGTGLDAAAVEKILRDGQASMPGGILTDDNEITAVAKYIADLK